MADTQHLAPTDAELLSLNEGEVYFSESPSKYPEVHGTQYHAGAPGVLEFARDVLATWGAQPVPASAAEFALQALVAAGHVTQERVDQAMALPGAPARPVTPPHDMRYRHGGVAERGKEIKRAVGVVSELERRGMLETQPVAREPLADEQILDLWVLHGRTPAGFVRAIERAHGITKAKP